MGAAPSVPTYGMNRLLLRYLVAKLGLWNGQWTTLVMGVDDVRAMLERYIAQLPKDAHEARQLGRIVERRLGN